MVNEAILGVAGGCAVAAVIWGRSSLRLQRAARRLSSMNDRPSGAEPDELAWSAYRKDVHTCLLYSILALALAASAFSTRPALHLPHLLLVVPIAISLRYGPRFLAQAQLAEERSLLERRYQQALEQDELAPRRWAARLAPEDLPEIEGFEVGHVYEPGTGLMAGDFYDLYTTRPNGLVAVIGDVAGHGIEPSITAFQVKYLLRVLLRQYCDPARAIEQLNGVMSSNGRPDELVSLCAVAFDQETGMLRFASAGHPAAWLWHDREVGPIRATGPLLTLVPGATYTCRELPLDPGDLLLLYTDGLAEARSGEELFGEERIAQILRRDPGQQAAVLAKALLEAARDFATQPLVDDVAILAIRRT